MAKKHFTNNTPIEEVEPTVVETPEVEEVVEPKEPEKPAGPKPKVGIVTAPSKLNVRKAPKADADIITVLAKNAKVKVDKGASNREWYKVTTENGIEGFCMKSFITLES